MKLYKHCESQFNPLNGNKTIKLGTFDYYANRDPNDAPFWEGGYAKQYAEYHDPNEGRRCVQTTEKIECIADELNGLKIGKASVFGGDGTIVLEPGAKIIMEGFTPPAWVFSCSFTNEKIFDGYDSYYTLPEPNLLAGKISSLLCEQLRNEDIDVEKSGKITKWVQHYYLGMGVSYLDQGAFDLRPDSIETVISNHVNYDTRFTKFKEFADRNYEQEKEYRFLFYVRNESGELFVPNKPKIINLNEEFLNFISEAQNCS